MLRCVLYVSTARAGLTPVEVREIVASSQRNNAADDITGLLLFNGGNFMQLLEGEEQPLGALLRRLYSDQRHSGLVKLVDQLLPQRACSGWAMQPVGIGLDQPERGRAVAEALPPAILDDVRTMILGFARLN